MTFLQWHSYNDIFAMTNLQSYYNRYENGEQEHCLELWNRDGKVRIFCKIKLFLQRDVFRVWDGTTPPAPSKPSSSVKSEVDALHRSRKTETERDTLRPPSPPPSLMSSQLSCLTSIDNFILIYNHLSSIISLNNSFNQNYFLLFYWELY